MSVTATGEIGDFRVKIKAESDKKSFKDSKQEIEGVEKSVKKLIGVMKVGVLGKFSSSLIQVETSAAKLSAKIGVTTKTIDAWSNAATSAGMNVNALTSSMANLENKMQHLKVGQFDKTLAMNLGMLGIGYGEFASMNAEQRMQHVIKQAQMMKDQRKAAMLVGDVLGDAGREYYDYLRLSGKTLDQHIKESRALSFTNEQNKKSLILFQNETKSLGAAIKSLLGFAGSKFAEILTPMIQKIKEKLITNKDAIMKGISGLITGIGTLMNGIFSVAGKVWNLVAKIVNKMGGIDKLIVRIGAGIVALKLTSVAGAIGRIVGQMTSLKGILSGLGKGLITGGLYLLLEDLALYFADPVNNGTVIGYVLDHMDVLKNKLEGTGVGSSLLKLADALKELVKAFTGADSFEKGMEKIAKGLGYIASVVTQTFINMLTELVKLLTALLNGDWAAAGKALSGFFREFGAGIRKIFEGEQKAEDPAIDKSEKNSSQSLPRRFLSAVGEGIEWVFDDGSKYNDAYWDKLQRNNYKIDQIKQMYEDKVATGEYNWLGMMKFRNKTWDEMAEPVFQDKYDIKTDKFYKKYMGVQDYKTVSAILKYVDDGGTLVPFAEDVGLTRAKWREFLQSDMPYLEKENPERWKRLWAAGDTIDDGIVSPNGRITHVSPQDWVIAAKDLSNVVSGFIPHGIHNNTSNMPLTVNQTITVNGNVNPRAVRVQAYQGARSALQEHINRAANMAQLMPGAR